MNRTQKGKSWLFLEGLRKKDSVAGKVTLAQRIILRESEGLCMGLVVSRKDLDEWNWWGRACSSKNGVGNTRHKEVKGGERFGVTRTVKTRAFDRGFKTHWNMALRGKRRRI